MSKMSGLDIRLRNVGIDPEMVDLIRLAETECVFFDGGACPYYGEVSSAFCDKCLDKLLLKEV